MEEVEELYPCAPTTDTADAGLDAAHEPQPPPTKLFKGRYATKIHSSRSARDQSARGQIETYFNWKHAATDDGEINPFKFWDMVANEMPNLAKLASRVLSAPASSAAVERIFSHGGIIMRPHRSSLSDSHLSNLIMLICNRLNMC